MVLAAGLAVLGALCWFVGGMIMGRGAGNFYVGAYAFLILAVVRVLWLRVSRGRASEGLPTLDRKAQWLVGGFLAFVTWWTLSTVMSVSGIWQPWGVIIGVVRVVIRGAWAALTGQSPSADLFPF
jgi:hypothetical protein